MTNGRTRRRGASLWLLFALCFCVAVGLPQAALAQSGPAALPAADQQAIKDYSLNEDVLNRLMGATKEARAQGIRGQAAPDPAKVHNLDDLATQAMASDARIPALVKKYGFTPREFILANIALMNAAMASQARNDPTMAKALDSSKINTANVAFFEAHQAQIAAAMGEGK